MASTVRKIATPARMTRISSAEPTEAPLNARSPGRRTMPLGRGPADVWVISPPGARARSRRAAVAQGRPTFARWLAAQVRRLPRCGSRRTRRTDYRWARSLTGVDRGERLLGLRAQVGGDRSGAGGVRRGGLTLLRDDVTDEALHQVSLRRVGVLLAHDVVGDEHDRVGAGLRGVTRELEGEVTLDAGLDRLGRVDDLGSGLRGERDELLADADPGRAQRTNRRGVGVADRAGGGPDDLDDTGGLGSGFATGDRPCLVSLVGPVVRGCRREVLQEVLSGARVVGTVHDRDGLVRELDVRVVSGNRVVVPVGDLLVEDLRQHGWAQVELGHTLQVERDGHRGDVDGDVH